MANNLNCLNSLLLSDVVLTSIGRFFSNRSDQVDAYIRQMQEDYENAGRLCECDKSGSEEENVEPQQIDSSVPCTCSDEQKGIVGTTGQPEAQSSSSTNPMQIEKQETDNQSTARNTSIWQGSDNLEELENETKRNVQEIDSQASQINMADAAIQVDFEERRRASDIWYNSSGNIKYEDMGMKFLAVRSCRCRDINSANPESLNTNLPSDKTGALNPAQRSQSLKRAACGQPKSCMCKKKTFDNPESHVDSTRMPPEAGHQTAAPCAAQRSQSLPRAPCACENKAFDNFKPTVASTRMQPEPSFQRAVRYPTQQQTTFGQPNSQQPSNHITFANFSPKLNSTELQPKQSFRTGISCPCGLANCRRQLQKPDSANMAKMAQQCGQQSNQQNARLRINFEPQPSYRSDSPQQATCRPTNPCQMAQQSGQQSNQQNAHLRMNFEPQPSYRSDSPQQATCRPTNPCPINNNTTYGNFGPNLQSTRMSPETNYSTGAACFNPCGQPNDRRQQMLQQQAATRAPNPCNMTTNMANPAQRHAVRQGFEQSNMINETTYMQLPQRFRTDAPQYTLQPQMRSEYQHQASYRQPMRPAENTFAMPMHQGQYCAPGPSQQYATRMDLNQGANNRHQYMNRETDSRMMELQDACCQTMRNPSTGCQCTPPMNTTPSISMTDSEVSRNNAGALPNDRMPTERLAQPTEAMYFQTLVQDSYSPRVLPNTQLRQEERNEFAYKIAYTGHLPAKPVPGPVDCGQARIDVQSAEVHRRYPARHSAQYRVESSQRRSSSNPNSNRNGPNLRRSSSTSNISTTLRTPLYQFRPEVNEAIAYILRA